MSIPTHAFSRLTAFIRHIEQELSPEGIEIRLANGTDGKLHLAVWYQGSARQPVHVSAPLDSFSRIEAQHVANLIRAALRPIAHKV